MKQTRLTVHPLIHQDKIARTDRQTSIPKSGNGIKAHARRDSMYIMIIIIITTTTTTTTTRATNKQTNHTKPHQPKPNQTQPNKQTNKQTPPPPSPPPPLPTTTTIISFFLQRYKYECYILNWNEWREKILYTFLEQINLHFCYSLSRGALLSSCKK